ncbi:MAG: hypothetical protein HRU41_41660 [Saprospiraceae bacterium]|nr:hypothetical protein [Saprospiraceae bacterium]
MSFSISTFIGTYPLVGFSGSRAPSDQLSTACSQVLSTISSTPVAIGCASGIDQLVRQAFPQARVFTAASQHPGALAARSAQLVRFTAASGGCLLVFPSGPCPSAIRVSSSFQGHGSGSWGSCALALGIGLPVLLCALVPVASWQAWAGPLAACFQVVSFPGPQQCWLVAPGSAQLSLF